MKRFSKIIAPVVVAILLVVYFVVYGVILYSIPDAPVIFKVLGVIVPIVFGGYAIWAAKDRIDEIKGGEDDDLSQY